LPEVFSIVDNTYDSLKMFQSIYDNLKSGEKLYLNLGNINVLTPDALLYTLSLFEYFDLRNYSIDIEGNYPANEDTYKLFVQSHFFKYVTANLRHSDDDEHVLHIESGTKTDGAVAQNVIRFALKHLSQNASSKSRRIYRILVEMMGNTVEHAYQNSTDTSKWYLMATHSEKDGLIRFAFLDGGFGVPATIRRNFVDMVKMWFADVRETSIDGKLLMSALNGQFRTRTEQGYRGKGLPNIYSAYKDDGCISKLRIMSNNGYVDQMDCQELTCKFHGTLFTWEFI